VPSRVIDISANYSIADAPMFVFNVLAPLIKPDFKRAGEYCLIPFHMERLIFRGYISSEKLYNGNNLNLLV